jgi:hypothetical protein
MANPGRTHPIKTAARYVVGAPGNTPGSQSIPGGNLMRHVRTAAALGAGVVLLLAGCSSSSKPAATGTIGDAGSTHGSIAPASAHAKLGTPQTLKYAGGTATMTLLKLIDPVTALHGTEGPGKRDVAVQVRIVGNGPAPFASGLMTTLHVFDAAGQRLGFHADWPTSAGPELDVVGGVNVAAGDTESGFVVFVVPVRAKAARFQYTPPGGSMVEWTLS